MALPATHIRFAEMVAADLEVTDRGAYLTGTLYPDSRWLTGLDRERTHADQILDPAFASDAFSLGWHIHCVCDRIQRTLFDQLLDGLDALDGHDRWVRMAAVKVIQDRHDAGRIDLKSRLRLLTPPQPPNGESADRLWAYLQLVRRAYCGAAVPDWQMYASLWEAVKLDRQVIAAIKRQLADVQADVRLVQRIRGLFDRMVDYWRTDWARPQLASGRVDG
jgi:hypothetical protein